MTIQNIERRVEKLETALRVGEKPETVSGMFNALERGDYGPVNVMSIVASIQTSGGSGDHLKGGSIPDELVDHFVDVIKAQKMSAEECR